MTALYFVLSYLTISINNVDISFASLPIIVAAVLFGPIESSLIALLGEFLDQVLRYGLTLTTAIWVIPPSLRGLFIGIFAVIFFKKGRRLEENTLAFVAIVIGGALLTTLGNTLALYLDSLIYDYPLSFVLMVTIIRFFLSIATAIVTAFASRPIVTAIRSLER